MKYDVIVIGGGPAGIISAVTARRYYPDKKILLMKSVEMGVIPCGIPYMFATLGKPDENAMGNAPLQKNNIELLIDETVSIDRQKKTIQTKGKKNIEYERLVIATGSKAVVPPIEGIDKKGIYTIKKDMVHLKNLKKDIEKAKEIVIIGGGFIGIEFADELSAMKDKKITLIEALPEIMQNSFDGEFSKIARSELTGKGINIMTGKRVLRFNGGERVESLTVSESADVPCQLVILGIGASPNTEIAEKSGITTGKHKGILVDEYLRTYSDANIFAVGDCAEKKDFFTRKMIPVMLASTATSEARIAGANLFKLKVIRENKGTIAIYSTKIGTLVLGSAGMTENSALREGFEIVIGNAEVPDKHPGTMPDSSKIKLKLVFSKQAGVLIGGQIAGGESAGEIINIIGLALQNNMSLTELETLQIATHPKLTAAPTMYPLIIAAQDALSKYGSGEK